ncbi:MAG TPA: hypothetical protein VGQ41_27730 [Pyrinomonadaceae bacterium]|jgi:hypothetical protein|nr:hypothetical protein [Pyrinomonadaceae bacterium]
MPELTEWTNFYLIVGGSAGALIGLQFVVLTLIAQRPKVTSEAGAAFATPSVVHFAVALLLSAIGTAPWHAIGSIALCFAAVGLTGTGYTVIVVRRVRTQKSYQPVFEDWLFHCLLPLAAYVMLILSALMINWRTRPALFIVAAATISLLFIGIHNAWDAVTYHVYKQSPEPQKSESGDSQ